MKVLPVGDDDWMLKKMGVTNKQTNKQTTHGKLPFSLSDQEGKVAQELLVYVAQSV